MVQSKTDEKVTILRKEITILRGKGSLLNSLCMYSLSKTLDLKFSK